MNENINLCEILKEHEGETFYSPTFGNVKLTDIVNKTLLFECTNRGGDLILLYNGKWCRDSEEISVFPSKDQRDWNKWDKENNHKTPKTWSELEKQPICDSYILEKGFGEVEFTRKGVNPIEKSALALLKIHQLIEVGYGGNVTNKEWINQDTKYLINPSCHKDTYKFIITETPFFPDNFHIAFHTKEQAEEFIKYPENIQLLKDYFMIN